MSDPTRGTVERTNDGCYFADLPDGTCIGVYPNRTAALAALAHYARTGERSDNHIRPTFIVGPAAGAQGRQP